MYAKKKYEDWGQRMRWMWTYGDDVCLNPSLDIFSADILKLLLCNPDILFLYSQVFMSVQFISNPISTVKIVITRSRFMSERHDRFIIRY